ncbi:type II secretion system F family protein [Arthrobacter sp. B0490]|uniref:type II secretion system F family protein n=1 Tax=Arthrobacter sp. B0490 TaxID=2058891 RepID=UPI0015E36ADE|nr:type II secretion system F family protein [Arthrobacter sp. B0490]
MTVTLLLAAASAVLALPSGRLRPPSGATGTRSEGSGIRDAPLLLDLLGAMVAAGASVENALSVVAGASDPDLGEALTRVCSARLLGASWESAWESAREPVRDPAADSASTRREGSAAAFAASQRRRAERHRVRTLADLRGGLRFATSTGAPSAALLHAHAVQLRRRHNREIARKSAALGVQLVLPLGLCSLPAFICLGVVPVVLGLLPAL